MDAVRSEYAAPEGRSTIHSAKFALTSCITASGAVVDVEIAAGRISQITPAGQRLYGGIPTRSCDGRLVVPCFVEGHVHLDKVLLGLPLIPHRTGGTILERIATEKELCRTLPLGVEQRGARLIEQAVAFGTGLMRTHVDIDTDVGLGNLVEVLALKDRYRDVLDLQIVAFPQSGLMRAPGTVELMAEAMRAGAGIVGGLDPAGIDDDVDGHLDAIFGLAERFGARLDIHLHDPGALGAAELRQIAARTKAAGLEGRVVVSHAYALGAVDESELARTADALAAASVSIMTNAPGAWPMPPVEKLRTAGVVVFGGSDNIRDTWWPYGDGDMLDRAAVIGYRQGLFTNDGLRHCFDMATAIAASALGISDYGLQVGAPANLVVLEAASVEEALLTRPKNRTVLHCGRVAAESGRFLASRLP